MLKALTKSHELVVGGISATTRWKLITPTHNTSQETKHQRRYFKNKNTNQAAEGSSLKADYLPPVPVFIAQNAASAIANHDRITRQLVPPLAIYSDGSKMSNRLGAAAVTRPLGTYSQAYLVTKANPTIQTAELMGVCMALSIATNADTPEVVVFSDSQATLKAIQEPRKWFSSSIGKFITEILQEVHQIGLSVEFHWVPAHKGVIGNQMADKLAKEAARLQDKTSRITLNTSECSDPPVKRGPVRADRRIPQNLCGSLGTFPTRWHDDRRM